jgi:hypothetical protein
MTTTYLPPVPQGLTQICHSATKQIVLDITRKPGGEVFWHSLPGKGKIAPQNLIRKWTRYIVLQCFPDTFINAMILACLSVDGLPQQHNKPLRQWVVSTIYQGHEHKLYQAWAVLNVKQQQNNKGVDNIDISKKTNRVFTVDNNKAS